MRAYVDLLLKVSSEGATYLAGHNLHHNRVIAYQAAKQYYPESLETI
jgi:hypothetical protein